MIRDDAPFSMDLHHGGLVPSIAPGAVRERRLAIRGIAEREGKLLMVYSNAAGDYKFPGGGAEEGETPIQTLQREFLEETGYLIAAPLVFLGTIREYRPCRDGAEGIFEMESRYFRCGVVGAKGALALEAYEAALGFEPVWILPIEALRTNKALLAERGTGIDRNDLGIGSANSSPWVQRETRILEWLIGQSYPGS